MLKIGEALPVTGSNNPGLVTGGKILQEVLAMKITGVVCTPRVGETRRVLVMQALAGAAEAGAEGDIIFYPGQTYQAMRRLPELQQDGELPLAR